MNFNIWKQVRHQTVHCFQRSPDALFELVDALCSEPAARTLPELSLSACFRRKWASVYEALEDGRIDETGWSRIWTQALCAEQQGPTWISVDSTSIPRPESETSPDRGMIYLPNLPHANKPVSVGWQFSTVMLLPAQKSSWGGILSQCRIQSEETAVAVAIQQLEQLKVLLPPDVRLLADRWYVTGPFLLACQRLQIGALLRLKRNRKLYRRPVRRYQTGRMPLDGPLFQGSKPESWGEANAEWEGKDAQGRPVGVAAWLHLHVRQAREVEMTVYRVVRPQARESKRDPRESWFCWVGPAPLPLAEVASTYQRRFSHEHTYRFLKQDLFWTNVRVRTPAQFERWSLVVATAMNQLLLARELGQALYRPWERRREVITPRQVRRVMPILLQQIGTPACAPKPRGKASGWRKGTQRRRPERFGIIKKPKPVPKTRPKQA